MALNNLAWVLEAQGNFAAAEPLYRQAVEVLRRTAGESDVLFGVVVNNTGDVVRTHEEFTSRPAAGEADGGHPRAALANSTLILPASLDNLAVLYVETGNRRPRCRSASKRSRSAGDAGRGAPGLREEPE